MSHENDMQVPDQTPGRTPSQTPGRTPSQTPGRTPSQMPDLKAALLERLEPYSGYLHGNRLASILAIKGERGESESAGAAPFFGADGVALESAFAALGWGHNSWCGVLLEPLGRPKLDSGQLRLLIEIIDVRALVTLDGVAVKAVESCYGRDLLPNKIIPGKSIDVLGRLLVGVDGFEAALATPQTKQLVWAQLKSLKKR